MISCDVFNAKDRISDQKRDFLGKKSVSSDEVFPLKEARTSDSRDTIDD